MSEFDSNAREAELTGQAMDRVRSEEWAAKRADDDSLRGGLERDTAHMDDPPEKIKLDDEPYDRWNKQSGVRDEIARSIDQSFFNSAQAEKRQKYLAELDLEDMKFKRSHDIDAVTALRQARSIDEGLRSPDFQTRVNTIDHMVNLAHNDSDYAQATAQRAQEYTTKEVVNWYKKHHIRDTPEATEQISDLMYDYLSTPGARKTGNTDADMKHAYRMATAEAKRVQFR